LKKRKEGNGELVLDQQKKLLKSIKNLLKRRMDHHQMMMHLTKDKRRKKIGIT
jgi:hypothetical protein